jgi:hypothetical protein
VFAYPLLNTFKRRKEKVKEVTRTNEKGKKKKPLRKKIKFSRSTKEQLHVPSMLVQVYPLNSLWIC